MCGGGVGLAWVSVVGLGCLICALSFAIVIYRIFILCVLMLAFPVFDALLLVIVVCLCFVLCVVMLAFVALFVFLEVSFAICDGDFFTYFDDFGGFKVYSHGPVFWPCVWLYGVAYHKSGVWGYGPTSVIR